jgi:superfamily II DNA or RNA helicase
MLKKEFTLRGYQTAFNRDLAIAVKQHRRVIGCAATGAGKSKTFLTIAANAVKKGMTVLVITESRKIYKQLIAEVHAFEIKPGSKPPIVQRRIYLAMAQTLSRRQGLIDQFKGLSTDVTPDHAGLLIINDECHVNVATGILLQLPNAYLIGFSGSPVGKHLVKLYNHLVVGPQPHELVLDGFLTPYKHFERQRAEIANLETDRTGEYTEQSQLQVFTTDAVYDGVIEDLRNPAFTWRKTLIFTGGIKQCELTAERLNAAGLHCVPVHSALKEKEEYNLLQFMTGRIHICVSVGILTKGFDFPPIDCICLLRKTSSLALYLQMIGRASRVLEEDINLPLEQRKKKQFTVFDYGRNCTKHDPWDWEREWQTLWREKPKKSGVPNVKRCPLCDFINPAQAKVCENCGYVWLTINTDDPPQQIDTVLVEMNAAYNRLIGKNIKHLNPKELSDYAKSKNKKMFAQAVCKWHAKNGDREFIKTYGQCMGYKPYWSRFQLEEYDKLPQEKKDELNIRDTILK